MSEHVLLYYVTAFVLGFLVGRVTNVPQQKTFVQQLLPSLDATVDVKQQKVQEDKKQKKVVKIDDKTFVTSVKTDALVKKSGELGTNITVADDVSSSISKLAQLKKSK